MKLNQYLAQNNIKPSQFKRDFEKKYNVKISTMSIWSWLNEKKKPGGRSIAMIQAISDDEVQAVDWYEEYENGQVQQR